MKPITCNTNFSALKPDKSARLECKNHAFPLDRNNGRYLLSTDGRYLLAAPLSHECLDTETGPIPIAALDGKHETRQTEAGWITGKKVVDAAGPNEPFPDGVLSLIRSASRDARADGVRVCLNAAILARLQKAIGSYGVELIIPKSADKSILVQAAAGGSADDGRTFALLMPMRLPEAGSRPEDIFLAKAEPEAEAEAA